MHILFLLLLVFCLRLHSKDNKTALPYGGRDMTVNLIPVVEALTALAGLALSVVTFTMAR